MKSLILIAMVIAGFATQLRQSVDPFQSGQAQPIPVTLIPAPDLRPSFNFGWYNAAPGGDPNYRSTLTVIGLPPSGERPMTTDKVGVCLQTADGKSWVARWEEMK